MPGPDDPYQWGGLDAKRPPAGWRTKKRKKRGPDGRMYVYVKATARRRGFLDTRLRRRTGPVCEKCGRRHWPSQKCLAGPESKRRDLKVLREAKVAARAAERAEREAVEVRQQVAARGPEVIGAPRREGARLVGGGGNISVVRKRR